MASKDSFNTRQSLSYDGKSYTYYKLGLLENAGFSGIDRLPFSIRVLLESALRNENGVEIKSDDIRKLAT